MKRSLSEISNYSIQARDNQKGSVVDFLLHDKNLRIKYMTAKIGDIVNNETVLIHRRFLRAPKWEDQAFYLNIDKNQMSRFPLVDDKKTVSYEYEEEMNRYSLKRRYWDRSYTPPKPAPAIVHLGRLWDGPKKIYTPSKAIHENELKSNLRSFKEIANYQIMARDKKVGHLHDIIFDDYTWDILYLVVDTNNWLPWSKKILVDIKYLKSISYENQQINLGLPNSFVQKLPEYKDTAAINVLYEKQEYDYHGRHAL